MFALMNSSTEPRGAEGLPIDEALLDIVEATHGVEVILLVVVEGCLFSQPTVNRIWICVDLTVVRVVIDVGRCSHRIRSQSTANSMTRHHGESMMPLSAQQGSRSASHGQPRATDLCPHHRIPRCRGRDPGGPPSPCIGPGRSGREWSRSRPVRRPFEQGCRSSPRPGAKRPCRPPAC